MILTKYTENRYDKDLKKPIKNVVFGYWDGEKSIGFDKEQTTVRKKEWLEFLDLNSL